MRIKLMLSTIILIIVSCNTESVVTDPQGNEYGTVKIGKQVWLTQNLKLEVAENSFCYNDDMQECDILGRLYTWEGAVEAASLIPGWRLPTKDEWDNLIEMCGKDSVGYAKILSDELGFKPQWSGIRLSNGKFVAKKFKGVNYWSGTTADTSDVLAYSVAIMSHIKKISPHNYPKKNACAVRLIKK